MAEETPSKPIDIPGAIPSTRPRAKEEADDETPVKETPAKAIIANKEEPNGAGVEKEGWEEKDREPAGGSSRKPVLSLEEIGQRFREMTGYKW